MTSAHDHTTHDTTRIDDTRIARVRPLLTPALLEENCRCAGRRGAAG